MFITVRSMDGAENPVFDRGQQSQVSSMIMFSVTEFTYVKTVKVTLYTFVPMRDLVWFLNFLSFKIAHCKICWLHD